MHWEQKELVQKNRKSIQQQSTELTHISYEDCIIRICQKSEAKFFHLEEKCSTLDNTILLITHLQRKLNQRAGKMCSVTICITTTVNEWGMQEALKH
jgi:hypothetical protein